MTHYYTASVNYHNLLCLIATSSFQIIFIPWQFDEHCSRVKSSSQWLCSIRSTESTVCLHLLAQRETQLPSIPNHSNAFGFSQPLKRDDEWRDEWWWWCLSHLVARRLSAVCSYLVLITVTRRPQTCRTSSHRVPQAMTVICACVCVCLCVFLCLCVLVCACVCVLQSKIVQLRLVGAV